ncbi:peptidase family M13 [Ostertagia ostertagi]
MLVPVQLKIARERKSEESKQFDENGDQRDWWKKKWSKQHDEKENCYEEQYRNVIIPKLNISIKGLITLSENTADNEGMKIAYKAHAKYLAKHKDAWKTEAVDGFTPDQLFFLGCASIFCRKTGDFNALVFQYSGYLPDDFRVNGFVSNHPAFASAFHCSSTSKMNPKKRKVCAVGAVLDLTTIRRHRNE